MKPEKEKEMIIKLTPRQRERHQHKKRPTHTVTPQSSFFQELPILNILSLLDLTKCIETNARKNKERKIKAAHKLDHLPQGY